MANELPARPVPPGRAPSPAPEGQQWAIQRRIEDVLHQAGEKFGDLSGRVVVTITPETPFEHIGGHPAGQGAIRGFTTALTEPDLYRKWGIHAAPGHPPLRAARDRQDHARARARHQRGAPSSTTSS